MSDEDDVNATQVVKTKAPSTAVAAQHTIETTLLALAREIRQPGKYVGYSAFILMGLMHKCQPCMWEGETRINLIETFAPWATDHCTKAIIVTAIACKLIAKPGGSVECRPISTTDPLDRTSHFVAGVPIPTAAVAGTHNDFDAYYASHGTAALATICDGDCGLDVMAMMLGEPSTPEYRRTLRIDISDYLMSRMGEHWMLELMALCQELKQEDVTRYKSDSHMQIIAVPTAVAEFASPSADPKDVVTPDEESFKAIAWASKLTNDSNVLSLIHSLPKQIVEE